MHYPYLRDHYSDRVKSWVMLLDSSFGIVPDEFHATYSATWGMYDNRPTFIPAVKNASPVEMRQDFAEIASNDYFPDGITAELGSSDDILQGFTLSKEPDIAIQLFHPRKDRWGDHFEWNGAILVGKSPAGRSTLSALRINEQEAVDFRQLLIESDHQF